MYLLAIIAVAGFCYEVAYGQLSTWVKEIFSLDQPVKYNALLYYKTWRQAIGNYALALSPFIFIGIAFRLCHSFLYSLLSCPYCVSVWLMFAVNYWVMGMTIVASLILAPVAIIFVAIIDKLRQ